MGPSAFPCIVMQCLISNSEVCAFIAEAHLSCCVRNGVIVLWDSVWLRWCIRWENGAQHNGQNL